MKLNRSKKPLDAIPGEFHLPPVINYTLKNNLDVYFVENKKLPLVKLRLVLPAGSRFDPYGNEGLAYLTTLTLDEGAGKFNALQLANEIDKLGSAIDLSTNVDHIFVELTSLHENFEETLKLLALIISEPIFENESFERERKKQITKINQMFDNPSYIAANAFQKIIFRNTGYEKPIVGYPRSMKHIELTSVKNYYTQNLLSSQAKLFVVGSLSFDDTLNLFEKYISQINFNRDEKPSKYDFQKSEKNIYLIHKEGAAQSEITSGHLIRPRDDKEYFPAKLANAILGGQFTSRINLNLREDKGYTYGAHSSLSYNKQTGYFSINTSVQSEFTSQSLNEIIKEIKQISESVSDAEIAFAKSSLVKQFPSMFETYSQLLQRMSSLVLFDLPVNYYDEYIQNVWDVTKEEILTAAGNYFQPERMNYFVVGDREKIKDSLNEIDGMNLIELDKFGNSI